MRVLYLHSFCTQSILRVMVNMKFSELLTRLKSKTRTLVPTQEKDGEKKIIKFGIKSLYHAVFVLQACL